MFTDPGLPQYLSAEKEMARTSGAGKAFPHPGKQTILEKAAKPG